MTADQAPTTDQAPDDQSGWNVVSDDPETDQKTAGADQSGGWNVVRDEPEPYLPTLAGNILPSAWNYAKNTYSAVRHPIQTGESLGNLIAGTFKAAARGVGWDLPENQSDEVARNFVNYYVQRYGSLDKAAESLKNDPVGTLSDFSIAMKGLGGIGKLAKLGKTAEVVSTVGDIANPAYIPGKAVEWVAGRFMPKAKVPGATGAPDPADPAVQAQIRQRAYDLANQTMGGNAIPGADIWRQAEREILRPAPAPGAAPVSPADAARTKMFGTVWKVLRPSVGAGLGTEAAKLITGHLTGSALAGTLVGGAIGMIPDLLRSPWGQATLKTIGPGTKPAMVMRMARDMVPKLNSMYRSQQGHQPITIEPMPAGYDPTTGFMKAKGGRVYPDPELARIQRQRLPLLGIREHLQRRQ